VILNIEDQNWLHDQAGINFGEVMSHAAAWSASHDNHEQLPSINLLKKSSPSPTDDLRAFGDGFFGNRSIAYD
jgi:hypothetical protein